MANGTTVDSLEIEIEASSSEAEKKLRALTKALENLQAATKGKFGDIQKEIQGISDAAGEPPAVKKTRQRRKALERATQIQPKPEKKIGFSAKSQFPGTEEISNAVDSAVKKYDELIQYVEQNKGKITRDAAGDALREIRAEQKGLEKILDGIESGIGQMPKNSAEIYAAADALADVKKKLQEVWNNPAPQKVNLESVKRVTESFGAEKDSAQLNGVDNAAQKAADKMKALKRAAKEIDSMKLKLTNELAKAEIQAVKTDGKLADLRRKLDDLNAKGAGTAAQDALMDAEDRFSAFSAAAEKAKERVDVLRTALDTLNNQKIDLSAPGMEEVIRESSQELKEMIGRYKEASNAAKLAGEEMKNSMTEAKAATKGLGESGDGGDDSLKKKLNILHDIKSALSDIKGGKFGSALGKVESIVPKGAVSSVKSLGGAFKGLTGKALGFVSAHPMIAAALGGVVLAAKKIGGEMKKLGQSAFSAAKKGFEALGNAAKNLAASLKDLLRSGLNKIGAGLKSIGQSVASRFTRPFKGALDAFVKWKSAIGRIAFYRAVREAIKAVTDGFKAGTDNLYQYSRLVGTQFAPAMNQLATSALYLKNSLGAMAAPLIQAVAPAIDFLIDKFVALINVIGKAFAMLTGKSVYTQAKKHAVEYGDAANAAAKATQKFLLGIDELTILDNPAGGGGGAASDFGSMFEEVEIDQDQFDWVKQIREAIENGEWRSVGELVAEKLNEVVESWDSYGWGKKLGTLINNGLNVAYGFLDKFDFENLGRKVADGLNGIFDTVDWDLLGRTFAAEWNALFNFIYGFATTLKWHEIGLDIAEAINGFLDELDAAKAARAVSAFVTGLFDMLNTAIAETNWNVLGDKLGQFISEVDWQGAIYGALSIVTNGLAALKEGLDSFLQSWTWQNTAQQTYTAVNQAFSDVDWGGLGNTLGNAFITAFNFLRDTIEGIEWKKIGSDVAAALNEINWDDLLSSLATTIASAFNAVVSALSSLVGDLEWGKVGKAVGNAINEFFDKFDFRSFFTGSENLVRRIVSGLSAAIEKVEWKEIGLKIVGALKKVDWLGLFADVGELIGDALTGVLMAVFSDPVGLLDVGAKIVLGIFEGMVSSIPIIGPWINENLFDPLNDALGSGYGEVERVTHEKVTAISEDTRRSFDGIVSDVGGAWDRASSDTKQKLDNLSNNVVSGAFAGIKAGTKSSMLEISGTIGETWDSINTDTSTKFGEIEGAITGTWSNTNTETARLMGELKDEVHNSSQDIQTQADIDFKSAADTIRGPIEGVVKDARGWGEDICKNLAAGMQGVAKGAVAGAATALAQSIRDRVHFSEPDVGPLSDFHTYMPDMLKLMASGIRDNSYLAVNAANDLASSMSNALGNIEPVEPQYAVRENILSSVRPQNADEWSGAANAAMQEGQQTSSAEVVNAMFAAAQQIVSAIRENGDRPISIDWSKAAAQTTAMQNRQNMMYGKTLQNA